MKKKFNITGMCIPGRHFIASMPQKLGHIKELVDHGDYFTINRPRQYGKTTIIYLLQQQLLEIKKYLVLDLSFEGISSRTYQNHERFTRVFLDKVQRCLKNLEEHEMAAFIDERKKTVIDFEEMDTFIADLVVQSKRNVVLMIDEVDKAGNNQLFLDFLGLLRQKYLESKKGKDHTFHSVILTGVHDIKTLKSKIRGQDEKMYNSPWNIAVDLDVDISLFPEEIESMLDDYTAERDIEIDIPVTAEKLFYYTSGHPFLVSSMCKIIDEKILPGKDEKGKRRWEHKDLQEAVRLLLKENNTNFDTLIKNLENNPELYEFVYKVIMDGSRFSYNPRNPVIHTGTLYGVLKRDQEQTRVHNRLYEQLIYDYLSSKLETSGNLNLHPVSSSYFNTDGTLNIKKVILKFQEFMKSQYSTKDSGFLERNGRLLFLAFLRPIINGKGFDFKEAQSSEEKRLDVVVIFKDRQYIVELKIWRGDAYHQSGLQQLSDYLDRQNQKKGYLLIYDLRKESNRIGESQTIQMQDKVIIAYWV